MCLTIVTPAADSSSSSGDDSSSPPSAAPNPSADLSNPSSSPSIFKSPAANTTPPSSISPPTIHRRRRRLPQIAIQDRESDREGAVDLQGGDGKLRACLLGKALICNYHKGENYLEIDVDIGSSVVASAVLKLAMGYVTAVTIDIGFLVEAQSEKELPEKLIGAVRIAQMEISAAKFVEPVKGKEKGR